MQQASECFTRCLYMISYKQKKNSGKGQTYHSHLCRSQNMYLVQNTKHISNAMININTEEFNTLDQETYNKIEMQVQLHRIKCSCGCSGCLAPYGSYTRHIKNDDGRIKIRVRRLRCRDCGRTHALLPTSIVPYSQVLLKDQVQVIEGHNEGKSLTEILYSNFSVDEGNARRILRNYICYWEQRLMSEGIALRPVQSLTHACI